MKQNIILISNNSYELIKEELSKIIQNEQNVVYMDYLEDGIEQILEEASYLSFFDDQKYLVVRNAAIFTSEKTKEEDSKILEEYLESPNQQTTLIFTTTDKIDERKRLTKTVKEKHKCVILKNLTEKDLVLKAQSIFKDLKIEIDYRSIIFLISSCLNNYDLVRREIEKIIVFCGEDSKVLYEDLEVLLAKNIEENIFKFADAVVKKDTKNMFKLFEDLKLIKEEPIVLINILAREFRNMYKVKILKNKSVSTNEIAKKLGMADWMIEKALKSSYDYYEEELLDKIHDLSELDINIKSGKIDKYLGIELFMLNM